MLSCNFSMNLGPGLDGNRNVVISDRNISENFDNIKVSEGLDLYITQGNTVSLSVEADENLQDIIVTEVENNTLKIHTTENIRNSASKKIMLSIKDVKSIKASSGSDVYSTNTIKVNELDLTTSSGADMELDVETKNLKCAASSGSDMKLRGKTVYFKGEASSGSDIKASSLKAETADVKASSGADISIDTSKEITAKASSGGDIKYSGNPEKVNSSDSSSGTVKKQ